MPELPDVTLYIEALGQRVTGHTLDRVRVTSPFLLRTFDPPIDAAEHRLVLAVSRIGKRIVLHLEGDLHLAIHLMIAGRLRWADSPDAKPLGGRIALATLHLSSGTLTITEASKQKRAALHLVAGRDALAQFHWGGIDPLTATEAELTAALTRRRHTLKRALTDPSIIDGVGNAYSDEILHAAGLSPFKLTTSLAEPEVGRLHRAACGTLSAWIDRLRAEFDDGARGLRFPGPGEITAFRPGFAVHGRFGEPCPDCSTKVQRVVFAEREFNYCPTCQTGGKVLADRSLSRLLRDDWPRTVEEAEDMFG